MVALNLGYHLVVALEGQVGSGSHDRSDGGPSTHVGVTGLGRRAGVTLGDSLVRRIAGVVEKERGVFIGLPLHQIGGAEGADLVGRPVRQLLPESADRTVPGVTGHLDGALQVFIALGTS